MARSAARRVHFDEFSARVRRHRPGDLLGLLAAISTHVHENDLTLRTPFVPWALAAAAKETIGWGTEFRNAPVDVRDVVEICSRYSNLDDPLATADPELGTPQSFFVRMAYEQFEYQRSHFAEIGRTVALFDDNEAGPRPLTQDFWQKTLGCTISEFVACGFLFFVGCQSNGGKFDPNWVDQENFRPIVAKIPRARIRKVLAESFGRSFAESRAACRRSRIENPRLRRFEYNPLKFKPLILNDDGSYLAPVVQLVDYKVSPSGIYYEVLSRLSSKDDRDEFTRSVGHHFQTYVGRQLSLLDAEVHPEIEYRPGQLSADWVVVWPSRVVVIEAKSTRMTQNARLGTFRVKDDVERALGRAYRQVDRTAQLIKERHPKFSHIPSDRPLSGMVVTLEPYYLASSPLALGAYLPQATTPTSVVSAELLEHFVAAATKHSAEELLQAAYENDSVYPDLNTILRQRSESSALRAVNAILDDAWNELPWMEQIRRQSA